MNLSKILLILIVSLLVCGPNQLLQIAQKLGKLINLFNIMKHKVYTYVSQYIYAKELYQIKHDLLDVVNYKYLKIPNKNVSDPNHLSLDSDINYSINSVNNNIYSDINTNNHNYLEKTFFYQPELDFERQPELFD